MRFRYSGPLLALLLALLAAGCPRAPRLPERADVPGLLVYEYAGIEVMHQYVDRDYVHLRLHFGWQLPEENSYAVQNLAVEGAFACGAGEWGARAWARRLEMVGVHLAFFPTLDGPVVTMDFLPERLPQAWELLDRALTDPLFERESFARLRDGREGGQAVLGAARTQQALAAVTAAAWPGLAVTPPWHVDSTQEEIALTTAQVAFRDLMRQRCNLRLIVTGRIEAERISDLLVETVEGLPEGACGALAPLPAPSMGGCQLRQESKGSDAAAAIFAGPSPNSVAALQMRLVMHLLEERLHRSLVEQARVASHVEARYVGAAPGFNLLQLSGGNGFQCAEFAMSVLRKLRAEGFQEAEVIAGKLAMGTQIGIGYESGPELAARLDAAAAAQAPTVAGNELKLLEGCDARSCNALLQEYLVGISWGIVGDTTGVDRKSLQRL